ncbi:hypothetical protein C0Q70_14652 [Pomacea canaliculata]|uniref:C-type lectin domain-containing protein n=1 Tax=Pomacea canaliculata TaxID=400727 RepID=A0A2T7NSQ3_POMCA|nr:hypothetical protein C0Q70_14652 [Pomacea canaliculata]
MTQIELCARQGQEQALNQEQLISRQATELPSLSYVRTPNWNPSIPPRMDSWTKILIPNHHMVELLCAALARLPPALPCNLVSDCVGNEDEVDCPYTGHVCGPGFLSANGTCLQFVKPFQDVSWETAAETCKSRGLVLMTANTPAEWEATRDLLQRYFPNSEFVLYGVQTVVDRSGWNSKYLQQLDSFLPHDECLGISIYSDYGLSAAECNYNYWSWFACKFPVSPDDTLPQMPVLTANWSVDVLQCPSPHYTHTFLACDVKSECWADKYDNSKTCSTPLTSRPPLFSCINEVQRVPYSLVCDHRSHCSDDSDEKFCIFSSCSRKKNVFECDNKQVNS